MAAIVTNMPVIVVIIPLFTAFILPTLARRIRFAENLIIFGEVLGLAGAAYLAFALLKPGGAPLFYAQGDWPAPWGIELVVDHLAVFFLLVVAGITLPILLYARGNLAQEVGQQQRVARFYTLFLLLAGALAGMAVTNDLFNVFVLVEVATLSSAALVSARNHPQAADAAFKYLILATLGSGLLLGGIGFIYITTGHLNMSFAAAGLVEIWQTTPHVVWMAASFLLAGLGVKSALFPLHVWLPDAHSTAPTPASAILSGLAVKGYAISLLKVFYNVFGPVLIQEFTIHKILALVGMTAIIAGSVFALKQSELKRRLAYSTVAQIGYIFLGFGLLNDQGLTGALFYLASHAAIKSALFLAAGALIAQTGKKQIKELAGVGRQMPLTMAVFTIASLGLVGIPLFSGFVGKWYLLLGSLTAGNLVASIVLILGSVLCAAYLFPVLRLAYFEPAPAGEGHDPGLPQKAALVILGLLIILLGVLPGPMLELAQRAALELLP